MASNLKYAPILEAAQQDAVRAAVGGGAKFWFYGGVQPAACATTHSQTLLASVTMGTPFSPAASVAIPSILAASDSVGGTIAASGTATWARLTDSGGTNGAAGLADFSVGPSGCDITVPTPFVAGQTISMKGWKWHSRPLPVAAPAFSNGGFEVPALTGVQYVYAPASTTWNYAGSSGLTRNGSAFGPPNAPEGAQAAFLQGAPTSIISQTFSLAAGSHTVTIRAAKRASDAAPPQTIRLTVDNVFVGDYTPPSGTSYTQYAFPAFTIATTGAHTIRFAGTDTTYADRTAFIDDVLIDYVIPPANPLGADLQRLVSGVWSTISSYSGNTAIAAAAGAAIDGDQILVNPGLYPYTMFLDHSLTIKSKVIGTKFVIDGGGTNVGVIVSADGKSLTLEDAELRNNKVSNKGLIDGQSGPQTFILRRCYLHDGANGIKIGRWRNTTLFVEDCEFKDNGTGDSLTHHIYVDDIASLTVRGCYFHNSTGVSNGHLLKSRAQVSLIEGNRLTMETGNGSRCIDLPNGGDCTVRGNLMEMNVLNNGGYNPADGIRYAQFMSFGVEEGPADGPDMFWPVNKLNVEQNTLINHNTVSSDIQVLSLNAGSSMVNGIPTYVWKDNVLGGFIKHSWVSGVASTYVRRTDDGVNVNTGAYEISETDNTFITTANLDAQIPGHATFDFRLTSPIVGSQSWALYAYLHPTQHIARSDNQRGAVPGSVPVGWGTGPLGSSNVTAGVWTPSYDANGVVNFASWNIVPLNTWISVAGTNISSLQADVHLVDPTWVDRGTGGPTSWDGVTAAWNGMAWDTRDGLERGWSVCNGGHNDSSNDGIYRLDLRKMKWAVQRMPTSTSWWPSGYNASWEGGFKIYPPANVSYGQNQANGNPLNIMWDEFYDMYDPNPAHSPRTPTAGHSYGSATFVPNIGTQGRLMMGRFRFWEYDLASNTWLQPKFPFGHNTEPYSQGFSGRGYAGENMNGWWDEVNNLYYLSCTQDGDGSFTWATNSGGTNWYNLPGPNGGWWAYYQSVEKLGRYVYGLTMDLLSGPYGRDGKPYQMKRVNLDTHLIDTFPVITMGASLAGYTFNSPQYVGWDGQGMTFIPDINRWLCLGHDPPTDTYMWIYIDPTTWVAEIASISGTMPMPKYLETKIKYLPALHAVVVITDDSDANIRLLKLAI